MFYYSQKGAKRPQINKFMSTAAIFCLCQTFVSNVAAENEISFEAVYTGEVLRNFDGGIQKATRYMDNFDLTAEMVSGDTTFFVYGLYNNNTGFSEDVVGDIQVVSNIDNSRNFRMYEAWANQAFNDGRGSVKVGLIDLNSEFDAIETAGLFSNSSHGIGADFSQSGENGPSIFPSTSLAIRLDYAISDAWTVRAGVFDSVPNDPNNPARMAIKLNEGALLVAESDFSLDKSRFVLGAWYYTDDADLITPTATATTAHNQGIYAIAETQLYSESGSGQQGLRGHVRLGFARPSVNQVGTYIGASLVYTGLIVGRDDDQVGIAIGSVRNGGPFKADRTANNLTFDGGETTIEAKYHFQVNDWIAIIPDFQYVINTGALGGLDNAVVAGFRFEIGYGWSR